MLSESIHLPKSIKDAENRFLVVLKEQLLKIVKAINELENKSQKINSSGNNYVRYESGLQVCWGETAATTSGTMVEFGAAFKDTGYAVLCQTAGSSLTAGYVTKTKTSVVICSSHATVAATVSWLVIGLWK